MMMMMMMMMMIQVMLLWHGKWIWDANGVFVIDPIVELCTAERQWVCQTCNGDAPDQVFLQTHGIVLGCLCLWWSTAAPGICGVRHSGCVSHVDGVWGWVSSAISLLAVQVSSFGSSTTCVATGLSKVDASLVIFGWLGSIDARQFLWIAWEGRERNGKNWGGRAHSTLAGSIDSSSPTMHCGWGSRWSFV